MTLSKTVIAAGLAALLAGGITGCGGGGGGGDNDDNDADNNGGSVDTGGSSGGSGSLSGTATGQVTSTQTGVIIANSGAQIDVPEGAVPLTSTGQSGTVTFSVEPSESAAPTPPSGVSRISDVYQFGPEGMTFEVPVAVTIPVTGSFDPDNEDIALYRINPSTGEQERYPSVYDEQTGTVTAQTYQFSPWYVGTESHSDYSDACFEVSNSASNWRTVYVANRTLTYQEQYSWEGPDVLSSIWPGTSSSLSSYGSLSSEGRWFLMQGSYDFCVEARDSYSGEYYHGFIYGVTNEQPWHYGMDNRCVDLAIGSLSLSSSGRCSDAPDATPTFGTGDLQFTLTWHSSPSVDLDLWVTEPSGERVYYGNTPSTTGGELDRDNLCWNYEDGKPENIYWSDAPAGQYKIEVDYYDYCSDSAPTVNYSLRVINGGTTKTYDGSISDGETVTVDTITAN